MLIFFPGIVVPEAGEGFTETEKDVIFNIQTIESMNKEENGIFFFYVNAGALGKWWVEATIVYQKYPNLAFFFYERMFDVASREGYKEEELV